MSFRSSVYAVTRRIPTGSVLTYGDVAELAGYPGAARQVGWALRALPELDLAPEEANVPWWRVVNRTGTLAEFEGRFLQAELLREEGIPVDPRGRFDLARYRWEP